MEKVCPVVPQMLIWRGWRHFFLSSIHQVGMPREYNGDWVCPVQYKDGDYGIVHARVVAGFNWEKTYAADDLRPDDRECAKMLRASSAMPEIIHWSGKQCLICFSQDDLDFEVPITFTKHGGHLFGDMKLVPAQ